MLNWRLNSGLGRSVRFRCTERTKSIVINGVRSMQLRLCKDFQVLMARLGYYKVIESSTCEGQFEISLE